MTHKIYPRGTSAALAALLSCLSMTIAAHAQQASAPGPSTTASASGSAGDKAGKPSVDALASQSGVATKKPAKSGAQAGPASGPQVPAVPTKK